VDSLSSKNIYSHYKLEKTPIPVADSRSDEDIFNDEIEDESDLCHQTDSLSDVLTGYYDSVR
jgi:hypothetical protein